MDRDLKEVSRLSEHLGESFLGGGELGTKALREEIAQDSEEYQGDPWEWSGMGEGESVRR